MSALHVDLEVDPNRETEMLDNFRSTFRPAISRQPGFLDVKLLKLLSVPVGAGAPRWRLIISFRTEEERLTWVASDDHQAAWPAIERTLIGQKFTAALYDLQ